MAHPIYDLAVQERAAALAEMKEHLPEAYAALVRAEATMATYAGIRAPETARPLVPPTPQVGLINRAPTVRIRLLPESQRVINAAQAYLADENSRRTSREITDALLRKGVVIGGDSYDVQIARVSANLSSAKTIFDNNRLAGGYGLLSWHQKQAAE